MVREPWLFCERTDVMWVVLVRAPLPDAQVWPGRRALALVDAVAWPMGWAAVVLSVPAPAGLVGPCALAVCAVAALGRAYRAVAINHRYYFTTWRWGRRVAILSVFVGVLKLVTTFSA